MLFNQSTFQHSQLYQNKIRQDALLLFRHIFQTLLNANLRKSLERELRKRMNLAIISILNPLKAPENQRFMFSGGIKWEHGPEIG